MVLHFPRPPTSVLPPLPSLKPRRRHHPPPPHPPLTRLGITSGEILHTQIPAGGLRVLVTEAAGFVGLLLLFFLHSPLSNHANATTHRRRNLRSPDWESGVVKSSTPNPAPAG
ncbi:hypothetical protein LINGRAHAP2_LOCUS28034 [Linum grandiflorum]